jgi:hypothetical protein
LRARAGWKKVRGMASERRASSAPGNWFLLWGLLLLSIWMAPAPDSVKRLLAARGLLLLLALGAAIAAGLRLSSGNDKPGARAGFVRAAGWLLLGGGLWATNAPLVLESVAARAAVLTVAGACLLISFVIDLSREATGAQGQP